MLLVGAIDTDDFNPDAVTGEADNDWWWYALYGALAVLGVLVQARSAERLRESMRQSWAARGGEQA
jgi:hypothetical protein